MSTVRKAASAASPAAQKPAPGALPAAEPRAPSAPGGPLTREDLETLKAPFPDDRLGVKVQSLNRERTRAMLVLYLQHTDVQDRLEEVDPAWTCEVLSEERAGDTVYVRSRMIVKGVARENVGEGGDPKAAYSDALKRCAMLFGVGRYLYDSVTVWTDYQEPRDKFRHWTIEDYENALRATGSRGLTTSRSTAAKRAPAPAHARSREELNRALMSLHRPYLTQFPETRFADLLTERYRVAETRLMTIEQLDDLVKFMEQRIASVA